MEKKEEKDFFKYFEECWKLENDPYPSAEIDPEEFRRQGLLKRNATSDEKKIRFFQEDEDNDDEKEFKADIVRPREAETENFSDYFVNFSRQMKESVSAPGDSVNTICHLLFNTIFKTEFYCL